MKIFATLLLTAALPLYAQAPAAGSMQHTADHVEKAPVPVSHSITVTYQSSTTTLNVEDLLKLPQVTVHVQNGHTKAEETYSGPLASDVLARAGLAPTEESHATILHSTVVATGTDGYYVLYSGAEVEPMFATGKVIVAVMQSGLPISNGGIQLVNTTDSKPARWVHGLAHLNVMMLAQNK
jgi:hypothetical protein